MQIFAKTFNFLYRSDNISIANLLFHQLVGFLSPEGSTVSWVKLDDPPEPLSDVTWKVMSTEPPPAAAHPVYGRI